MREEEKEGEERGKITRGRKEVMGDGRWKMDRRKEEKRGRYIERRWKWKRKRKKKEKEEEEKRKRKEGKE